MIPWKMPSNHKNMSLEGKEGILKVEKNIIVNLKRDGNLSQVNDIKY